MPGQSLHLCHLPSTYREWPSPPSVLSSAACAESRSFLVLWYCRSLKSLPWNLLKLFSSVHVLASMAASLGSILRTLSDGPTPKRYCEDFFCPSIFTRYCGRSACLTYPRPGCRRLRPSTRHGGSEDVQIDPTITAPTCQSRNRRQLSASSYNDDSASKTEKTCCGKCCENQSRSSQDNTRCCGIQIWPNYPRIIPDLVALGANVACKARHGCRFLTSYGRVHPFNMTIDSKCLSRNKKGFPFMLCL